MANGNTPQIDPRLMMMMAAQQGQGQNPAITLDQSLLSMGGGASPAPRAQIAPGQQGQTQVNDASLAIPVTGQPTGVPQQQMSYQDLMAAIGKGQQPQQVTQATDRGQQVQRSGQAPAAVRYNNPGAMWPGSSSKKFGSTDYGVLRDGNLIASFPTPVHGAAAQFDLLNSDKYINKPIIDLIDKWSGSTGGAENVAKYAKSVANAMGVKPTDRLTPELLRSPAGIAFVKAQAKMETGYDYPMSDDQWTQAQRMAFPDIAQR